MALPSPSRDWAEMTGEAELLAMAFKKSARASGEALRKMLTHPL